MQIEIGDHAYVETHHETQQVSITSPRRFARLVILSKAEARALFGALRELDNAGELEED